METIEKSVEVLNDLIEINNDRIAGFSHAAKDLDINDADLRSVFENMKEESRQYVRELSAAINQIGGEAEYDTSGSGALHRAWLDVKATFTGNDRKSILAECERGEDAIKKAYQDALAYDGGLSTEYTPLVLRQQTGIIAAHNRIKALRDNEA